MSATLASVRRMAAITPGAEALVAAGARLTYGELHEAVEAAAACLRDWGVGPGDRVVLAVPSSERLVILLLALQHLSAQAVPLECGGRMIEAVVDDVQPVLALCARDAEAGDLAGPSWRCDPAPLGTPPALAGLFVARRRTSPPPGANRECGAILYTSGSSGAPKGVLLTRACIDRIAAIGREILGIGTTDRIATLAPLTHFYSMREIDTVLGAGATLVLAPFDPYPSPLLSFLRRERVTGMVLVPAMLSLLLSDRVRPLFLQAASSLRFLAVGTAFASSELRESLRRWLPDKTVLLTYGLTECSRVACGFLDETPDGSAGRAVAGTDISIRTEAGEPCAAGRTGRVHVRSRDMMGGYWSCGEAPRLELTADGYLATDDLAAFDADGFLYLRGRADDVTDVGGHKVSLVEVEAALSAHPEVAEAVALRGTIARAVGESVFAAIIPARGAAVSPAELMRHCSTMLPAYKCPRKIILVDEICRTSLGKPDRPRMARLLEG